MKLVKASQEIAIPEDVKLEVKARKIRVTGPRGEQLVRASRPVQCQTFVVKMLTDVFQCLGMYLTPMTAIESMPVCKPQQLRHLVYQQVL